MTLAATVLPRAAAGCRPLVASTGVSSASLYVRVDTPGGEGSLDDTTPEAVPCVPAIADGAPCTVNGPAVGWVDANDNNSSA